MTLFRPQCSLQGGRCFPLFCSQGNTLGKLSEFPRATLAMKKAQHPRIPGWSSQPHSPSLSLGTRRDGSRVTDYSSGQSSWDGCHWNRGLGKSFSFGLWQCFTIVNQLLVLFAEIKSGWSSCSMRWRIIIVQICNLFSLCKTAELYVSDREGNDVTGDGTKEKPFKTGLKVVSPLTAEQLCVYEWLRSVITCLVNNLFQALGFEERFQKKEKDYV